MPRLLGVLILLMLVATSASFVPRPTSSGGPHCDARLCSIGADDAFGQQVRRGIGWTCWAEPTHVLPEGYAVFCDPVEF